jgi:hypothetical protein
MLKIKPLYIVMEWLTCLFTNEVEKNKEIPNTPPSRAVFYKEIKECSNDGCMLEFTALKPVIKKAKIASRNYSFCCEYCYEEWLSLSSFRY